ncbi:SPOR domain-containing protein [Aquabacterium sp. J223]|uniref:SPOR domain-containing protein n=1 Tax=Aquabacterium sp. J223 TaxID=2898431 RepID=UPI0021ADF9D6|nr:SPOR domain-containing protein [Aquabacterium sp. J223]UUX96207.1 SPOR domain-containing protein [Aquabacterium sp. J223]
MAQAPRPVPAIPAGGAPAASAAARGRPAPHGGVARPGPVGRDGRRRAAGGAVGARRRRVARRSRADRASHLAARPAPGHATGGAGSAGFWLQLGAFRDADAARGLLERLAAELSDALPRLTLVSDERLHRVQAGPYRSRSEAQGAADRLRARLAAPALVIRRR